MSKFLSAENQHFTNLTLNFLNEKGVSNYKDIKEHLMELKFKAF